MADTFKGKTVFITGGSRGIGQAIAVRLAKEGANVAIVSKTTDPNPKLPGTIYSAAKAVEEAGGKAIAIPCDIRYEDQIEAAVKKTVETFGGIDILVNNASAIWLKGTSETPMKKFDLMMGINTRGTYACSQACLPYLKASAAAGRKPQILNLSPPLNMKPKWFQNHVAYTMAKYGMSMCVLGMAEEFRSEGIAVNALWPRTGIATAAIAWITGEESLKACRTTDIMSEAAYFILKRPFTSGNFFIDDEVLLEEGYSEKDLEKFAVSPGVPLFPDFFVDEEKPRIRSKL
eukprot:TRINITY_DN5463_c0_g1_i1.p1 TRINITY_DN5463_c0_g1~~TRINITY_DN5463_c0_g1_i1.p1  ORF type:complete len:289 (+),score=74.39 TRINITY_DN5463_c0_g1_i1:24-890(+)